MRKSFLSLFLLISIGFSSFAQTQTKGAKVPATADQNFHCQDIDGNTWDLFDLLDAGKYVLLDFDYNG